MVYAEAPVHPDAVYPPAVQLFGPIAGEEDLAFQPENNLTFGEKKS